MLSKDELNNIRCLGKLTNEMIFRLLPEVEKYKFEKNDIIFKQHQAKNVNNIGKIFKRRVKKNATWLDDLKE